MSRLTNSAVFLVAGLLVGLWITALRPNTDAEHLAAARDLVTSYQRQIAQQTGQLSECTDRLAALKRLSVFDALAGGAVKP